ncbi:MAG TPA: hypothetical protein PLJ27_14175, partial [Polyangiaceae bacterium]|nr:hypothetical protein [Polyangiaceae bacterium]
MTETACVWVAAGQRRVVAPPKGKPTDLRASLVEHAVGHRSAGTRLGGPREQGQQDAVVAQGRQLADVAPGAPVERGEG